ncbi:MAG: hypothetical protein Q4D26_04835 [Clostridia bacterium]|nr:hypothetical protein [Clostridia bacterium]
MKKLFLILLSLTLLLTACKEDRAPDECISQTNRFVDCFKAKDFESMYEMTVYKDPYLAGTYDENSVIGQKLFNAMADSLSFEITGGSRDGNDAYVNAHVVTVNFGSLLDDVVTEYTDFCKANAESITSDQMGEALESILDEALKNPQLFEKDTSLDFVKQDGKWVIEDNVGIYDDLSGGYLTYCFGVNSAIGNIDGKE